MSFALTDWPMLDRTIWTAATIAVAFTIGLLINSIVIRRLQRLAERTAGDWDDAVIVELRRRIPLWGALAGVAISIRYWPLEGEYVGFIAYAVLVIAVLSVTAALAGIAVRWMTSLGPRMNPEMQVSGLMKNVVRMTIFTVGLLVILNSIGVEVTPVLAALGVGGLAVALALQVPLSNLFAGLFVTVAGQVRIGDYIRLETGQEGTIADFSWNATQLISAAGNVIIVPNAKLAQALITNFHRPTKDTGLTVELTVAPDSDLAVVERVGIQASRAVMKEVRGGLADFEPNVRFAGFSDLGVRVGVNVRATEFNDQALVRHELIKRLHSGLKDAGIRVATLSRGEIPKSAPAVDE